MKRTKMSPRKDKKVFTKTALRMNVRNAPTYNMRGGIRL